MHAYMLDGIRVIVAFCEDSDLLLYELQGTILEGLLTAKKTWFDLCTVEMLMNKAKCYKQN